MWTLTIHTNISVSTSPKFHKKFLIIVPMKWNQNLIFISIQIEIES